MPTIDQVHHAWLAAGAKGDAETMKRLRDQHPQWLELKRLVVASDSTIATTRFCTWEHFHLPTIGASALLTAAWDGCFSVVAMLLEAGQDPDTSDDGGSTAMMVSILRYNILVMRCVFRNGLAVRRNLVVDCREDEDQLMQHILEIIGLLLHFGADINARNKEGYTALHYAANGDVLDAATALLDAGADIDAQDQNGKTPLHQSIREESLLVASLLVSRGAQIDIEDGGGVTPLMLVLQRRSVNMLQILLNHHHLVAVTERRDFAASVLLSAVEYDFEAGLRLIVEGEYAPVLVRNDAGETPLHRAIMKRSSQLMELLVSLDPADSSLTVTTLAGDTISHYTARYGSVGGTETLLRHLNRVFGDLQALEETTNPLNTRNRGGITSLYVVGTDRVSLSCHLEECDAIARLLLLHGSRLFPRDSVVIRSGSVSVDKIMLHTQARRGIPVWIRQARSRNNELDGDDGLEAQSSEVLLTELCMAWVGSIALPSSSLSGQDQQPDISAVLHVGISAGYALDLMPLLVELPLAHLAMPALLRRLEHFSRSPREHILLLELFLELSEALVELAVA